MGRKEGKLREIEERQLVSRLQDEAKKCTRTELEELYVDTAYLQENDNYVNSTWRLIAIALTLFLFLGTVITITYAVETPNSEMDNIRALSNVVCELTEQGNLKYTYVYKDLIKVDCYNGKINIPVQ